jgi:hypothetical protein
LNTSRKLQLGLIVAAGMLITALTVERITTLRIAAEQLVFEHAVTTFRAAVTVAMTRALVANDTTMLEVLDRGNPVDLLSSPPLGYQQQPSKTDHPPPRSWYFDAQNRELIYWPRFPEGFVNGHGRLQLRVIYVDRDGDGLYTADRDSLRSAGLSVISGIAKTDHGQ